MAGNGSNGHGKRELKFPVLCHYKIIVEDVVGIEGRLKKVLLDFGIRRELGKGRRSSKSHYLTYNVEVVVNSKEFMEELDTALRAVPGVKFIL